MSQHPDTATASASVDRTPAKTATRAYAAASATDDLHRASIERRTVGPHDVSIDIQYCGVCHSDLHTVRNEWGGTVYPCVPGHEIVGVVREVGAQVTRFREGDRAGVGCMVDSCRTCPSCLAGLEQYCEGSATFTYNSVDAHTGGVTYGGYSERIVVDEAFTLRIADHVTLAAFAPLLCAGITTYSPLRHWNVREGQKVGVVGLGGLGHMAVKLARAFDARFVLFTTSPGKIADGLRLGASDVVVSTNEEEMARHASSFDFILDTVSALHNVNAYLALLKRDGTLTIVGAPPDRLAVNAFSLVTARRSFAGSLIGGLRETQEMLDFCAERDIAADIEIIPVQQVNTGYERMLKGDVRYRFVLDMATLGEG